MNLWGLSRIWAVSYTHLDVYKRQILAAFNTGGESAELRLEDAERIELLLGSARFQISAQGHVLTLPPRTGSLLKLSVSGDALQEPD